MVCTLGLEAGVAGSIVDDSQKMCQVITFVAGTPTYEIVSLDNNEIAHLIIDAKGFDRLLFMVDIDGSATSGNALVVAY